jgi:sulfatase modifying factor 1
MKKTAFLILILLASILVGILPASAQKELPKIAVWDLEPRKTPETHARELTSFVVSEITKLKKYEVYSQENVRTLAGWTSQQMQLGCTDTKCLTALGQIDIAKLISCSVGKIGKTYTVTLNLFDTQKARPENAISKTCDSEDELIGLIQASAAAQAPPKAGPPAPVARTELDEYRDPVTGMEFVLVKGGCYQMGDTFGVGNRNENPVHEVCVGDFYLGKHEVTQGQWRSVMGNNPSSFKDYGDDSPVEQVSWNDAQEFISRLNRRTGKGFRLPTEAEWEYAARSGGKKEKYAGASQEDKLGQYAWYKNNSGSRTHPVGQKDPNGLGLYDMSGNVWEWCSDWYDENYYGKSPRDNPRGPDNGTQRVLRGGSWYYNSGYLRTAYRSRFGPPYRVNQFGFRLALAPR